MVLPIEELDRRATSLERAQAETTETLRWVVTKLARVQAAQDEHTLRLERVESKVDAVAADVVTLRGEVGDLRGEVGELRGEVGELRGEVGELRSEVRVTPRVVAEMIADSEKRTLTTIADTEKRMLTTIADTEKRLLAAIAGLRPS